MAQIQWGELFIRSGQNSGSDLKENEPTRHLRHALVFRLKYDGSNDPLQLQKEEGRKVTN